MTYYNLGRAMRSAMCPNCYGYNSFYVWSWAGHGKAKCRRCGMWIPFQHDAWREINGLPPDYKPTKEHYRPPRPSGAFGDLA